jgi:hypothetical protein
MKEVRYQKERVEYAQTILKEAQRTNRESGATIINLQREVSGGFVHSGAQILTNHPARGNQEGHEWIGGDGKQVSCPQPCP